MRPGTEQCDRLFLMKSDQTSSAATIPASPTDDSEAVNPMDFHDRLTMAAGQVSYRKLGTLTETHPETVRRYMQGHAPSASFLTNLCRVLGISGEWMLTGRGPMKVAQMKSHALNQADPSELMTAVANTLTDLCDRMDRMERYIQTLETRVRGSMAQSSVEAVQPTEASKMGDGSGMINPTPSPLDGDEGDHGISTQSIEPKKPRAKAEGGTSAQRVRSAVAKRSS